jgi:hypothetical protein
MKAGGMIDGIFTLQQNTVAVEEKKEWSCSKL